MTVRDLSSVVAAPVAAPKRTRTRVLQYAVAGVALLVAAALPYVGVSGFVVSLASTILISATLAASVNFLAGQGGMVSLGHAGIAAAAAYGAGWASRNGFDTLGQFLFAVVLTIIASFLYGLLSMRTSGIYLLMVTLAVGMLVYGLAFRLSSVTNGENGISGIKRPEWMGTYWVFYYVTLAAFVLSTAAFWVIAKSPFGAGLRGIRDSESRMRSLGYSVRAYKLAAFMMSGMVAGLAGLLSVWHTHFVSPSTAGVDRSVHLIVMVILGGIGTMSGPLLGAGIVVLIENVLSSSVARWPTVLGLVFILVILFARAGIAGSIGKLLSRKRRPDHQQPPSGGGSHDSAVSDSSHEETSK